MALEVQIRKQLNNGQMLNVHFECRDGCAVLGAADSGKTVLLSCISGITAPDEGRIVLNGQILYDSIGHINLPAQQRRVGLLSGDPALFPGMTVNENIHMALFAGGKSQLLQAGAAGSKENQTMVATVTESYLHAFHLDGLGGCYPEDLSDVQKIRAAAARLMAAQPSLVLLDDPFCRLEAYEKARLLMELRDQFEKKKVPVVFASRDRDEVFAMNRQVLALHEGRSQPLEAKQAFFSHPSTISAALLAGVCNVTNVRLLNSTHAVSGDWGMVFCLEEEEPAGRGEASTGQETSDREGASAGNKTSDREVTPALTENSAGEGTSAGKEKAAGKTAEGAGGIPEEAPAANQEDRTRAERRKQLHEDLERSLRFELVNTDEDQSDAGRSETDQRKTERNRTEQRKTERSKAGRSQTEQRKTEGNAAELKNVLEQGSTKQITAADQKGKAQAGPALAGQTVQNPAAVRVWQKFPENVAAIGVPPDAFVRRKPEEGAYVRFRLHDVRIEEDVKNWMVYFRPYPSDQRKERTAELLWEIPKKMIRREEAAECRVLYLPAEKLLLLTQG